MPRIFQMNMYICKPKQSCSNTSPPTFRETRERSSGPSALLLPSVTLCGGEVAGRAGAGQGGALLPFSASLSSLVLCRMNAEIRTLLSNLGSSYAKQVGFRDSWVFLGARDLKSKSPFEQVGAWWPPHPSEGGREVPGWMDKDTGRLRRSRGPCGDSHPAVIHPRGHPNDPPAGSVALTILQGGGSHIKAQMHR